MLDERTLHITYERNEDDDIDVVITEFNLPEAVEVPYDSQNATIVPLKIHMPKPFPYDSSTIVPWKYNATIMAGREEVKPGPMLTVVNITDVSCMTRNGNLFAQNPPYKENPRNDNFSAQVPPLKDMHRKNLGKEPVTVVDQLLQTQSKISLLSLLINSKAHQNALIKILNQTYVEHDVTLVQIDNVVSNITINNVLSFSKEEIPPEGREHNHSLHISMKYGEYTLTNVLVDIGSSVNVMPKSTLDRLSYYGAPIRLNEIVLKAFDGSKRNLIRDIDLHIHIRPNDFEITFQIMDIYPAYSCLLGRLWVHSAGAITYTLHQMLKFVVNDKLITVYGEKTIFVSQLSSAPNVNADIEEIGTQFEALEVVNSVHGKRDDASISSWKDAQEVVEQGLYEGWGHVIELPTNRTRVV
ncbi:uncharacterized protein LOC131618983 [Vicia villosa]|uniref:uncharacterized protein LOC131618983 n=1 Tax=Vicia villosa TaxID=3911 RepID=UPI00273BF173|nr:uncharacterized protein LOC131618983 [Vicia villosa]